MRAIWSGAIGFGLVNIPIKLYSASEESTLDLDMLDSKDFSNIKFKRVNEKTGKEVAYENIVKGYKMDDKYIVLEKEDFEGAMRHWTAHENLYQGREPDPRLRLMVATAFMRAPTRGPRQ